MWRPQQLPGKKNETGEPSYASGGPLSMPEQFPFTIPPVGVMMIPFTIPPSSVALPISPTQPSASDAAPPSVGLELPSQTSEILRDGEPVDLKSEDIKILYDTKADEYFLQDLIHHRAQYGDSHTLPGQHNPEDVDKLTSVKLHSLCDTCKSIRFSDEEPTLGAKGLRHHRGGLIRLIDSKYYNKAPFSHHKDIASLEISAQAGCHLCTLIAYALKNAKADTPTKPGQSGPIQLTWAVKQDKIYPDLHEFFDINYNGTFAYLLMSDARPNLSFLENYESIFRPAHVVDELGSELSALLPPAGETSLSGFPKKIAFGGRVYYRIEQENLGEVYYASNELDRELRLQVLPLSPVDVEREKRKRLIKLPDNLYSGLLKPPHPFCSCGIGVWETPFLMRNQTAYIEPDPYCAVLYAQIKSWLQQCDDKHARCRPSAELRNPGNFRLINVGPPDGSEIPLLEEHCPPDCRYITLSYRWGSPDTILKTTTNTLAKRKKGIPEAEMPRTMRDAVTLTRRLGTQYLWIDALCIIQDSEEDWLEQAARMGEIYAESYLSISAHNAESANSGFIRARNALELRGCLHPTLFEKGSPDGKVICPDIPKPVLAVGKSTLNSRGWTLQEQSLPRRVLHWGPHELFWECNQTTAWERQPVLRSRSMFREPPPVLLSLGLKKKENNPANFGYRMFAHGDLMDGWYSLVQEYSKRALTFSKDKLPAIAGIAKVFQSRFSTRTYLAGLWYEDISRGLAWLRQDDEQNQEGFKRQAPSFSWASVDFPVVFPANSLHEDEDAKALDYNVKTKHGQMFGEVESARVKIRARVMAIKQLLRSTTRSKLVLDDPSATKESLDPAAIAAHLCSSREHAFWTCQAGVSRGDEIQYSLVLTPCSDGSGYQRVGCLTRWFIWIDSAGPYGLQRGVPRGMHEWKEMDIVIF